MLAAVLIRGTISTRPEVRETLKRLNLTRKNSVVFVEDTPQVRGMLQVVKDYIAYGPVSDETVKAVVDARGEEPAQRPARSPKGEPSTSGPHRVIASKDVQLPIRLSPPRGGYERGGIKQPFTLGGALGERPAMDALITRMI